MYIEHDGFPTQSNNNSAYLLLYKRKDIMAEYKKDSVISNELRPIVDSIKINNDKFNQEKRIINSSLSELLYEVYSEIFTNFNDYSEMLNKMGVNRDEIVYIILYSICYVTLYFLDSIFSEFLIQNRNSE